MKKVLIALTVFIFKMIAAMLSTIKDFVLYMVAILLAITTAVFGGLYVFELLNKAVPAAAQTQQMATPQLRVYDGNVQWFNGASWQNETTIKELEQRPNKFDG